MAAIAPPALPVIPPRGFGDFQHCSVRYGVDILPADCQLAGVDLPSGPNLKTYYTTKSHDAAYTLPWSKTVGSCTLMVELAGPLSHAIGHIDLVPDHIRGMAGHVIQRCPGGGDSNLGVSNVGIGGFVTAGLENVWDWMERSSLFLSPNHPGTTQFTGSRTDFITVTVQNPRQSSRGAGDTDVNVANRVLGFVRMLWDGEDNQPHKDWYWNLASKMEAKVAEMSPNREDVNWWGPAPLSQRNHMDYVCVNKLDKPAAADCAMLQHRGLGKGTIDLNAGETKYFNEKTCALAVSATRAMTLTWNQIGAAFYTLYTLCVDRPLLSPLGGHASFSANPTFRGSRMKAKRIRDTSVTGLNAMPEGSMLDMWKHAGDRSKLPCELAAVLKGQPPGQCVTSRHEDF